ncbi:37S ribosomal protein S18, mitochondrial [[Candida] anglica]|uniref:37S ribosomal protein S18, mitochondrial n=1 Tax=[Candida] anglica TaxID=148631 RepID=A0ABP0EFN7_9ASCO
MFRRFGTIAGVTAKSSVLNSSTMSLHRPVASIFNRSFSSNSTLYNASSSSASSPVSFNNIGSTSAPAQDAGSSATTKSVKNEKVVLWKLNATFNRHNTLLTLVAVVEDLDFIKNNPTLSYNEQVMYYLRLPHHPKIHVSAGQLGFRKAQRAEYEAGYQVTNKMFKLIEERHLLGPKDKVELVLNKFGKGREAFLAALQGKEGAKIKPHIVRISDDTKIKFGGVRSKKLRRL